MKYKLCVEWGASWKKSEYWSSDHGQSDSIKINFLLLYLIQEKIKSSWKNIGQSHLWEMSNRSDPIQFESRTNFYCWNWYYLFIIENIKTHKKCNGSASDID